MGRARRPNLDFADRNRVRGTAWRIRNPTGATQIESRNNNAVAAFVAEIKEGAMQEFMWDQPVKLSMPGDGERCINGPREALHCLAEWTDAGGWFYERAKNRCHAAIEMNGDLALSRQAFIAAAIDASLQWD